MSNHHQISSTAWLIAKMRCDFSEIPHCKQIAKEVSSDIRPFLMSVLYSLVKFVASKKPHKIQEITTAESRYLSIDDLLPQDQNYVLIELASGLSPRGINHALQQRLVIESDLSGIIQYKENLLQKLYGNNPRPDNHHLLHVNALDREHIDNLGQIYQKIGKELPLYVVHEGLTLYFTLEEKEVFRENISYLLRKFAPGKGYWITTDFNPLPPANKSSRIFKTIKKSIEKLTKRELATFETLQEVESYLQKSKMSIKIFPNDHILDQLYSLRKMGLPREALSGTALNYQASLIQPEEQLK